MTPLPASHARHEQRDVVVIGASAGGVEALEELVGHLPAELPAAVFVVLHVMPNGTSALPSILDRAGALAAEAATDGKRFERGSIYVAPPDFHLLVDQEHMRLTRGPRENGHRPAVDPMFRSAARHHGRRVVGIVLSGTLDDGTDGLRLVEELGGTTLVQEPDEAQYPGMPNSAIDHVDVDLVGSVEDLASRLSELLDEPLGPETGQDEPGRGADAAEPGIEPKEDPKPSGEPAGLTCPDCDGPLWEQLVGTSVRFECRVGHAFSPESLVAEQSRALEGALWSALQSMQERADLLRRVARRGPESRRADLESRAKAVSDHATVLSDTLTSLSRPGHGEDTPQGQAEPIR